MKVRHKARKMLDLDKERDFLAIDISWLNS